ncbi:GntR family transcriptional regulator [Pseudorhodobacter sp.]|uniref:GntR family transcriptional regulator n=1 Tax=Pseudorhodobacter sp. TaxID=1934400 RepID=UPI002649F0C6|nr:GntR family transcriptional regulator [Pseudorhodobacter sp.]MDN5785744.1 GntR family transcriptional regulator [Pseudorhodobacter sp.]
MTRSNLTEALDLGAAVGPQLYRVLWNRIVRGDLAPGTRLSETDIATVYGTSRQPVREAFIKLAEASLIEVRPQRGSYVRRIDPAAVRSAQFVREAVEADIVRGVAERASPKNCDELDAILTAQAETIEIDDPRPFMASDESFHRKLAQIAGQGAGWDFLQPLKTQMDRVRHLSARQFPRRILVQQHRQIVSVIRVGDADTAEQHMRHHLRRILEDLPLVAAALPSFFEPVEQGRATPAAASEPQ